MKKSLKKVILTCSAVSALMIAMSASAMAAVDATYNPDDSKVTIEVTGATANSQVTLLVLKPGADDTNVSSADIAYIDQQQADANGAYNFVAPLGSSAANGTYTVKVGGDSGILGADDFKIGSTTDPDPEERKKGDVDDDGDIDTADATRALQGYVGKVTLTEDDFKAAEVTNDQRVDTDDVLKILDYCAGKISEF